MFLAFGDVESQDAKDAKNPTFGHFLCGRATRRTRRFSNELSAGAGRVSLTRLHVGFKGKHHIGVLH